MKDYYSDQGGLFARIFCSRELPDYVRDSSQTEKIAAVDSGGFADQENRLFPIHTAADTYISAAYFAKQAGDKGPALDEVARMSAPLSSTLSEQSHPASPLMGGAPNKGGIPHPHNVSGPSGTQAVSAQGLPAITPNLATPNTSPIRLPKSASDEVADRILKAASVFGIFDDVVEVMEYAANLVEKVAEAPSPKVASFEIDCGMVGVSSLAGCGPDAVHKAAAFIIQNLDFIPVANLMKAAETLEKAASENGTKIDSKFKAWSGQLKSDPEVITQQKTIRLSKIDPLGKEAARAELELIQDAVELSAFDQKHAIHLCYGKNIDHPCNVFHSLREAKEASFEERMSKNLLEHKEAGVVYQALEATAGKQAAIECLEGKLSPEMIAAITPYLQGVI